MHNGCMSKIHRSMILTLYYKSGLSQALTTKYKIHKNKIKYIKTHVWEIPDIFSQLIEQMIRNNSNNA